MGIFETEFDTADSPSDEVIAEAAAQATETSDADIDEELAEAEKRLAKAAYYKAIVRSGVIEDDGTPQAAEVNDEARKWARQRMAVLVGIAAPQPVAAPQAPPQFNDREVVALKKVAEKVLASMGERPADPVVKMQAAPAVPTVKKVAASAPPKAPKTPVPPAPKAPAGKTGKPKTKSQLPKTASGQIDYAKIPSGEVFTDVDGQNYRFIDNRSFDPDRTYDALVAKGVPPELAKAQASHPRIKSKVAGRRKGVVPMPDKRQMEMITAAQANETTNVGGSASATSPFGGDGATQSTYATAAALSLRQP